MSTLLESFRACTSDVGRARERVEAAELARAAAPAEAANVMAPLRDYWRQVTYKRRERDERLEKQLERAFVKAIRTYRVRPRDPTAASSGFILVDPRPDLEYAEARAELSDALQRRAAFVSTHGDDLRREADIRAARGQEDLTLVRQQLQLAESRQSAARQLLSELGAVARV